jgi:hypothetical protein
VTPSDPVPEPAPAVTGPSLREILGGREGALDASVPVVVFVLAWVVADGADAAVPVAWAAGAAVLVSVALAVARLVSGRRPRAVLIGLLGVAAAATVALYTGRAVDFFLVQMIGNAASALVWTLSIVVRWPLLGIIVGTLLGQRTRWRRDPDLRRGYQRASWVWVAQYVVRLAVFVPLYLADAVVALGVARVVLTAPLVLLCVVVSWWVLRAALPAGHGGLRQPVG